jgi:lysyl-tRNA synthetase class II
MSYTSKFSSQNKKYRIAMQDYFVQGNENILDLAHSLQLGYLTEAQKIFSTIQKDIQSLSHMIDSKQTNQNDLLNTDFNTLAKALATGDLTGAQIAFGNLQLDMQYIQYRRHHHHHKSSGDKTIKVTPNHY